MSDPTTIFWIIVIFLACIVVALLATLVSLKAAGIFFIIYLVVWVILWAWALGHV
jgi:hypothetical protein